MKWLILFLVILPVITNATIRQDEISKSAILEIFQSLVGSSEFYNCTLDVVITEKNGRVALDIFAKDNIRGNTIVTSLESHNVKPFNLKNQNISYRESYLYKNEQMEFQIIIQIDRKDRVKQMEFAELSLFPLSYRRRVKCQPEF